MPNLCLCRNKQRKQFTAAAAAHKETLEQSSHGRTRPMLGPGLAPFLARVARGGSTEILAVFLQEHRWGKWCLPGAH